jgi:RarD protein
MATRIRKEAASLLQGYAAIVASMLIWGSVGVFARKAGQDPLITVTFRVLLAGAAMALITLAKRTTTAPAANRTGPRRGPGHWLLLAFSGMTLATNWLFFFKAVATTSVSNAVLSYYAAPVLVALASPFLLKEKLEGRTMIATALAFGGVFVMLYQPGQTLSSADVAGIGYGLIAACFYAMVTITGRWLADVPAARLVLAQCLVASAVLLPTVLWQQGAGALAVPAGALALLVVVGVVHTGLALFLYFQGLRSVKVQHVGVLAYLDPVSAVLFAYLFLGEVPTAASLAGGALVLAGSALLLRRRAEAAA